jgi:hypothetical protein
MNLFPYHLILPFKFFTIINIHETNIPAHKNISTCDLWVNGYKQLLDPYIYCQAAL